MARQLVELYLACAHSTGDVERCLKEVAFQHSALRSCMLPDTVEHTLLVAVHAPPITEILERKDGPGGTELIPKGRFLIRILQAYKLRFGEKVCARQPRKRRDAGMKRDLADSKRRRMAAGRPQPEAEFLREQGAALDKLVRRMRPEAERAAILGRSLLGPAIPAEGAVRIPGPQPSAPAVDPRPRPEDAPAPPTPAHPVDLSRAPAARPWGTGDGDGSEARRHGLRVQDCFVHLSGCVGEPTAAEVRRKLGTQQIGAHRGSLADAARYEAAHKVYIVKNVSDSINEAVGLACKLTGGFLVAAADFLPAVRGGVVGALKFKPAATGQMALYLTRKCRQAFPEEVRVLSSVCASVVGWRELDRRSEATSAYREYKAERGQRSKPWLRYRVITAIEEVDDHQDLPRLAQSMVAFTRDIANCDRTGVLQW